MPPGNGNFPLRRLHAVGKLVGLFRQRGELLIIGETFGQIFFRLFHVADVVAVIVTQHQFRRLHLGRIIFRHGLDAMHVIAQPLELGAIFCHQRRGGIGGGDRFAANNPELRG